MKRQLIYFHIQFPKKRSLPICLQFHNNCPNKLIGFRYLFQSIWQYRLSRNTDWVNREISIRWKFNWSFAFTEYDIQYGWMVWHMNYKIYKMRMLTSDKLIGLPILFIFFAVSFKINRKQPPELWAAYFDYIPDGVYFHANRRNTRNKKKWKKKYTFRNFRLIYMLNTECERKTLAICWAASSQIVLSCAKEIPKVGVRLNANFLHCSIITYK